MQTLNLYYQATKPGIVRANLFTSVAGYFLISNWHIEYTLLGVILGTTFVVASGCIMNNIIDKQVDLKMPRTKNRPIATNQISTRAAFIYGLILLILGIASLYILTNTLTLLVGILGFVSYVVIYTYAKRYTKYGTEIGTIPGATPILAGAFAANPDLYSKTPWLLFVIMLIWQLPHFYAISIFRKEQYRLAKIKVASHFRSFSTLHLQIVILIAIFTLSACLVALYEQTKFLYVIVILLLGFYWLKLGLKDIKGELETNMFAKKVFGRSIFVLSVWCLLLICYKFLPF